MVVKAGFIVVPRWDYHNGTCAVVIAITSYQEYIESGGELRGGAKSQEDAKPTRVRRRRTLYKPDKTPHTSFNTLVVLINTS